MSFCSAVGNCQSPDQLRSTIVGATTSESFVQAGDDPEPAIEKLGFSDNDLEFFERQIRPILVDHCYECHSGTELSGGLSIESRAQMLAGGDSGPAMRLGEPEKSLLVAAISYQHDELKMPPAGKLSDAQIAALTRWITTGAADTRIPSNTGQSPKPLRGMSLDEGRQFWAFQPVANPHLPSVDNPSWLQSPVDAFVLGKLEQRGIVPAPPASRAALIRRVYLNLIGLPPSPVEVDQFVNDPSPGAFADLVEQLLASPQYGVRWGRHWLDVARYADSNGLDENMAYGNAWRYRDYVVAAFNTDKPYNQFVIEQIAGDLLPDANEQSRVATGFLALGAKVLAEPDMEKLVMDTVDEQIDCVGKAFMGLSLGCARCHDHKFDPLTQRDYYALAAIFKGTRTFSGERFGAIKYWYEHSMADPAERERIKSVDARVAAAKSAAASYKSQAMSKIRSQAVLQAADYLMAATQIPLGASLVDVAEVARPLKLHPRILYHCRQHLENQRESEFFAAWHRLRDDGIAVQQHYADLFSRAWAAWEAAQRTEPKVANLSDGQLEQARQELNDPSGMLVVPPQPQYAFDEDTLREYYRLMEEARILESGAEDLSAAMGVADGTPLNWLPIHIRGSHLNLGEPIPRGFPIVMQTSTVQPILPDHQSGRLELAQWLASTTHPLTARVIVNRIWGWHFGRPLVNTTENFGALGGRPTHPELLDWLARSFMQSGWSIKQLHRLILNSSTYQMDSQHPQAAQAEAHDPANDLLWKFRIQRLDAEQLRDSLLSASGLMDAGIGGKSVPLRNHQFVFDHTSIDHTRYDSPRRTLYLPIIRNNLYTLLEQFDFPDPTMPTGWRQTTTVAPQSLWILNADLVMDAASQLARQITHDYSDTDQRINEMYVRLLARLPGQSERQRCTSFLAQAKVAIDSRVLESQSSPEFIAWSLLAQGLMATNDFLYVR
ncbi:MAG: PSD1 domain-containing protein [Pirellulaceae bacterium]|nr:PSD1 domain-containing protein [Pirellulaceae bacterium]